VARLIYSMLCSLDGFSEDSEGGFEWAMPSAEVHAFVNEIERPIGTHLYGRRMYETMAVWETLDLAGEPAVVRDFAESWRAAEKVVYSRTLAEVASARTRIEPEFDPVAVRALKEAADRDLGIGGPELAAAAFAAGLVDELHLFLFPVTVGDGKRALPAGLSLDLELLGERRFGDGVAHLHYRVR
jgi:dihydrofolate reductase